MAGEGPPGKFTKATLRQTPLPVLEEFSYRELQFGCSYSKQLQDFILSGVRLFALKDLPEDYANENGFGSKFSNFAWLDLISKFLIVIIILSCSILMSILGLLWCVFRKKFSKKVRESENRIRRKIRLCVTLLLLLLTLSLIVALVMAYKMNEMFGDVTKPRSRFVNGLNFKARAQVDGIARQITTLLNDNFSELKTYLSNYLQTTVRDMMELLKINGRLLYISELAEYRNQMDDLLINTMRFVDDVRFFARNMTVALDKTKWGREIYTSTRLKYFQDSTIKMDELARLDGMLQSLESIVHSLKTINQEVETLLSESRMEKVVQQINQPILNHLEEQELQLNRFEQQVNRKLRNGMDGLEASTRIGSITAAYRMGVLFCVIITLIAVGLLCSLIFGLYKEACGVAGRLNGKVSAASCLAVTIWLIFMTIFAIGVISSYYFLLGMVVHSGLCKSSFRSTLRNSRKFESPASLLIRHCKQRETAYVSLLHDKVMDKLNISLFPSAALEQLECPFCGFAASNDIFATHSPAKFVERASRISSLQAADYGRLKNELHFDYIDEVYQQIQQNNAILFDEDDQSNMSCVLHYFKQAIDNIARGKIVPGADILTTMHRHLMTHFSPDIKTTIERYMANGLSKLFGHNFRTNDELKKQHSRHELYSNTEATFKNLLEDFKQKAEDYMFSKLKSCEPIVRPYRALLTGTCTCLHIGLNGFWIFAFIIFFLLLPICCLSIYLKELYQNNGTGKPQSVPLTGRKKKAFKIFGCIQKKDSKAPLLEDLNEGSTVKNNPTNVFSGRMEEKNDPEPLGCGSKCTCPGDTTNISLFINRTVSGSRPDTSTSGADVIEDDNRIPAQTSIKQASIEQPKSIMKGSVVPFKDTPKEDKNMKEKTSTLLPKEEDKGKTEKSSKKWLCCKKKGSKASVMNVTSEGDEQRKASKTCLCCNAKNATDGMCVPGCTCAAVTSNTNEGQNRNADEPKASMAEAIRISESDNRLAENTEKQRESAKKSSTVSFKETSEEDKNQKRKTSKTWFCCKKKDSKASIAADNDEGDKKRKTSKTWLCCKKQTETDKQTGFPVAGCGPKCTCSPPAEYTDAVIEDAGKNDKTQARTPSKLWLCCKKKDSKSSVKTVNSAEDKDVGQKTSKKWVCCKKKASKASLKDDSGEQVKKQTDKPAKKWSCCAKKPSKVAQTCVPGCICPVSNTPDVSKQTVSGAQVIEQVPEPSTQLKEQEMVEPGNREIKPQIIQTMETEEEEMEPSNEAIEPQTVEPETTKTENQVPEPIETLADGDQVPQQSTPIDEPTVLLLTDQTDGLVPIEQHVLQWDPRWVCDIGCECKSRSRQRRKAKRRVIAPQMFQLIDGQFTDGRSQQIVEQFAGQQISGPRIIMGEHNIYYLIPGEQMPQWDEQADEQFFSGDRDSSTSSRESRSKRKARRRARRGGQRQYLEEGQMSQPDEERGEQFFEGDRDSSVDSKDSRDQWKTSGNANRGRKTVEWHAEPEMSAPNTIANESAANVRRVPRPNLSTVEPQMSQWNMQMDQQFFARERDSSTSSRESRRNRKAGRRARRGNSRQLSDEEKMPGQGLQSMGQFTERHMPAPSTMISEHQIYGSSKPIVGQQMWNMETGEVFSIVERGSSSSSKDSKHKWKAKGDHHGGQDAMEWHAGKEMSGPDAKLSEGFRNVYRMHIPNITTVGQQSSQSIAGESSSSASSKGSRRKRKSRRKARRGSSRQFSDEEEMPKRDPQSMLQFLGHQMSAPITIISGHETYGSSIPIAGLQMGGERDSSVDSKDSRDAWKAERNTIGAQEAMTCYTQQDMSEPNVPALSNTSTVGQQKPQSVKHMSEEEKLFSGERDSSSGSKDSSHKWRARRKARKGSTVQFADEKKMPGRSRKTVEFTGQEILGSSTAGGRALSNAREMPKSSISIVEPQTSCTPKQMGEQSPYGRRRSSADFRRKNKFKAKRKTRWGSSESAKERKNSPARSTTIDDQLDGGLQTDGSDTSLIEQFISGQQMAPRNIAIGKELTDERSALKAEEAASRLDGTSAVGTDEQQTSEPNTPVDENQTPAEAKTLRYRPEGSGSHKGIVNQLTDSKNGVPNPTMNDEFNTEQKTSSETTEKLIDKQNTIETNSSKPRQLKYRQPMSESQMQTADQFVDARHGIVDCTSDCFCEEKSLWPMERQNVGRAGNGQQSRVQNVHSAGQLTYRKQMPTSQKRTADQDIQVEQHIFDHVKEDEYVPQPKQQTVNQDRFEQETQSRSEPIGEQLTYRKQRSFEQTAAQFVRLAREPSVGQDSVEWEKSSRSQPMGGQLTYRNQASGSYEQKGEQFVQQAEDQFPDEDRVEWEELSRSQPMGGQLTFINQVSGSYEQKGEQFVQKPEDQFPGQDRVEWQKLSRRQPMGGQLTYRKQVSGSYEQKGEQFVQQAEDQFPDEDRVEWEELSRSQPMGGQLTYGKQVSGSYEQKGEQFVQQAEDQFPDEDRVEWQKFSRSQPMGGQLTYGKQVSGSYEQKGEQFVQQAEDQFPGKDRVEWEKLSRSARTGGQLSNRRQMSRSRAKEKIAGQVSDGQETFILKVPTGRKLMDRKQMSRSDEKTADRFVRQAPQYPVGQFREKRKKSSGRSPTDEQLTERQHISRTSGQQERQLTEREKMPGTSRQAGERLQREQRDTIASGSDGNGTRKPRRVLKMTGVRVYRKPKGHKGTGLNGFNVDL